MRSEKRKRYLIQFLAIFLAVLAPIGYLRVLGATDDLLQVDFDAAFSGEHIITDRDGTILYEGECLYPELLGNLFGTEGLIANSLYNCYVDEMQVAGFNPLEGRSSLKGTTMKITLMSLADQQEIQKLYGDHDGCCFAYNYETGEVYIALSLPSGLGAGVREGSMHNGCLNGTYTPASTLKILTTICALAQNAGLKDFTYTCQKQYMLPDGNVINCHNYHGTIGLADAIGLSCNCYFTALVRQLNVKDVSKTLAELGILNEGTDAVADDARGVMDRLSYITGKTKVTNFGQFQSVWGMVGQGNTVANPVYMAMTAGAVANGGTVAQPYIMEEILSCGTDPVYQAGQAEEEKGLLKLIAPDTAQLVQSIWSQAVEEHYHTDDKPLSEDITLAKTGTAEEDHGDNDRLLLGVMEDYNTAFFIMVKDSEDQNGLIYDVANQLAESVKKIAMAG